MSSAYARSLPRRLPGGIAVDTRQQTRAAFVAAHCEPVAEPLGVARPRNEDQIRELLRWANRRNVALVPVSSCGGPRRRQDTAPTQPSLVVDLSGMQRVIHVDGRDRIAVIEPGVTFPAFDEALRPHGLRSIKPLLPRRNKSVLAAYLEREPTIAPNEHWDTTDPLAALSITFGSGEPFRTGGASLPGTLEENLRRGNRQMMASGPIVTDYTRVLLGSQGTLGIVSWASIYCEPIPVREESFLYGAGDYAPLAELMRLLALRQLGAHCFVLDRTQLAAALADGPGSFEQLARDGSVVEHCPPWLLYVSLVAGDALPEQHLAWQRADLTGLAEAAGAHPVAEEGGVSASRLAERLQQLPQRPYKDVPRGAHRELFCLSQLDRVPALLAAAQPLLNEASARGDITHGVYVQPTVQGASCHFELTLFHGPESAARAAQREAQLVAQLADAGGFFSRPYGAWAEVAYGHDPAIVPYLRQVKQMFDPKGLLNPGRLCF